MSEFGQRVGLLHELAQLRTAEELADSSHHRTDVDQRHGSDTITLADRHAFADHALHAPQTHTQLRLDQFADGFHAAIAEVIDVIRPFQAVIDEDHVADIVDDVLLGDRPVIQRNFTLQIEALVQLVTTYGRQIITAAVVQLFLKILRRVVERGRVARTHALIELDQRLIRDGFLRIPIRFLLNAALNIEMLAVRVDVGEQRQQFFIGTFVNQGFAQAVGNRGHGTQEQSDGHCALAIELDGDVVGLARLKLHPCAAIGNQLPHRQRPAGRALFLDLEISARRANQLTDNDTLRSINNEGACRGHERKIAHENILLNRLI